jgi:hypothetical protein
MKNICFAVLSFLLIILGSCTGISKKEGLVFKNENGDTYRLLFRSDSIIIFSKKGDESEVEEEHGLLTENGKICVMTPFDWVNGCEIYVVDGAQLKVEKTSAESVERGLFYYDQHSSTDKLSQHFKQSDNSNQSSDSMHDENNLNQETENKSQMTVGEIRGMVYGSTLSQVEEEIGCINYNWEGENNSENDNCPGKRLQVNSGLMCLDYNFVVYKDFVLNSKKEVSDLLIVVKDWGKTYSKVTYVGIFNGNLDPYEHCQDR